MIGGGPAGLTAAIYLSRFRRRFRLFDAGASRADWIPIARNYPGFPDGLSGRALLERMREQALRYGADMVQSKVEKLSLADDGFEVATAGGVVRARRVMLATGVVENEPNLPDCADAVRRGLVRICPICDGYEGADKSVGVLGNSDHAAAEALFLRTYSDRVTLVLVGENPRIPQARRQALADAGVPVVETAIDGVSIREGAIHALNMAAGEVHSFDTLYAAFGVTPQYVLAEGLGANRDEDGRLIVGSHQETSVPGLYAAGDVVRGLNQIAVATGEAALAATAVHNSLPRNPA